MHLIIDTQVLKPREIIEQDRVIYRIVCNVEEPNPFLLPSSPVSISHIYLSVDIFWGDITSYFWSFVNCISGLKKVYQSHSSVAPTVGSRLHIQYYITTNCAVHCVCSMVNCREQMS